MVGNEKIPNKLVLSNDGNKINIITGVPYRISHSGLYVDDSCGSRPCLSPDYHPPDHFFYLRQLWVLKETSYPRGYKIAANGNYMDSLGGGHKAKCFLSPFDNPPEDSAYSQQIWSFYSETGSKSKAFQIKNEQNTRFLGVDKIFFNKKKDEQNNRSLDIPSRDSGSNIYFRNRPTDAWNFIPAFDYKLNAVVDNFEYKIPPGIKTQKIEKTIHEDILNNLSSSSKLITTFDFQEGLINTFKFSFNESLDFISETKLITVIPFKDIEKEFNFKYSFEANKSSKIMEKELCTTTKTIEVSPKSCVKVTDYCDFMVNIEIPFKATAEITAICDRYKEDGTIVKNSEVEEDAVRLFLKENNFQGKIIKFEGNSIFAKVNDTFRGSYVLKTYRKLEDIIPMVPENTVCID
ncbi:1756_t:CDS:1 [Diversispora eburnea]|uniref:1756_t:CDS:1 n=1 Tax=Diversispora eburnea TaxID=1213867 RepID=A0A9N9F9U1_9GLOM|nr:1756_t:CDS:1 [Diversispora eburnea]